jgi:hypothetical protein
MPIYQVGTCMADAERRIENRANTCGFDAVVWDHGSAGATPLFERVEATHRLRAGEPLVAGE